MSESEPLHNFEQVDIANGRNGRMHRVPGTWRFYLLAGLLFTGILTLILVFLLFMEPNIGVYSPQNDGNLTVGVLLQTAIPIKEHRPHIEKKDPNFVLYSDDVKSCIKRGQDDLRGRRALEERMLKMNRTVPKNSPASYHQQATALNLEFRNVLEGAVVAEGSIKSLLERDVSLGTLKSSDVSALLKEWPHCKSTEIPQCSPTAKFRTLNGACNNLNEPNWGASLQPFRRISPPMYDDKFSSPRTTSMADKQNLPSARSVSLAFQNATLMVYETRLSMLFLTFGQFLDHDLSTTAPSKAADGGSISCCGDESTRHPECFPIMVDDHDQFYKDKGVTCIELVRSAPAPQCAIGEREQMNQNTAFIDASMVYGTTHLEADVKLRVHQRGYVRSRLNEDGRWMLAISPDPNDGCNRPEFMANNRFCFKSGDGRTNEQIALTSFHTIFVREHNRIASELVDLNPHWDDDRVYWETRRIVGAMIQHITYNEFLPLLLGKTLMNHLDLRPLLTGYSTTYDPTVNAGISNEFTTAAFRFGHSMLQGLVVFEGARRRNIDYVQLHKTLFYPFALWDFGKMDAIIRGGAGQNPRTVHTSFSAQTTNHMFQPMNSTYGMDLFAVNIQRGRDHGLATYVQWRQMCNLEPATEWAHLEGVMKPVSLEIMKNIYKSILDVDLYVGILAEEPISDGILGPVGTCIIADQFLRLKRGDRFWYETSDPLLRFTPEQLGEIRKVTLARLLCDNGDALDSIQPMAMESVSADNPRRACSDKSIPHYDISHWEEDDPRDALLP